MTYTIHRAASSRYGSSFVVVGGEHLGSCPFKLSECVASKYIYFFEHNNKTSSSWKIRDHSMDSFRKGHLVVTMPDETSKRMCSKKCQNCTGQLFAINLKPAHQKKFLAI